MNTSSSVMLVKFLANSLILQDCKFTLNTAPDPAGSTVIEVVETPYPIPA